MGKWRLSEANDSDKIYFHGSQLNGLTRLSAPIIWLTDDYEYAKSYTLGDGSVYTCTIGEEINWLDLGTTDEPVYTLFPTRADLSPKMAAIANLFKLTPDQTEALLADVAAEFDYEKAPNGKFMRKSRMLPLSNVIRSEGFKRIAEGAGYSGVMAREVDKLQRKYCNAYGVFDESCVTVEKSDRIK